MEKSSEFDEKSCENSTLHVSGQEENEAKLSGVLNAQDESHSDSDASTNEDEKLERLDTSFGKTVRQKETEHVYNVNQRHDENSDSIAENIKLEKTESRGIQMSFVENDENELEGGQGTVMQMVVEPAPKTSGDINPINSQTASKPAKKKGRQSASQKASSGNPNESAIESSSSSGQKRRKKDPMAPKAPLNAYLLYFNEERSDMRQKNPGMSFGELTKIIATKWKDLSTDEKQRYINEAETDKERYSKEMADYKKSDAYKQYLKENAHSKSLAKNIEDTIIAVSDAPEPQASANVSTTSNLPTHNQTPNINWLQQESNVAGFDIPIFTEEFLEHSKAREQEMRQLRKEVTELEQQNSFLQKHLENMSQSSAKIQSDMEKLKISTGTAQKHAEMFKQTMLHCFGNLPLPNSQEYPTPANIDDYIMKLYSMVATQQMDNSINSQFVMHVKSTLSKINFSSLFEAL